MKVAIVGSGNAGCAHAVKLKERGHAVRLIKTSDALHNENFERIVQQGGIRCIDSMRDDYESFVTVDTVTRDIGSGVAGADVVMIMTQSLQHRSLAPRVAPYLESGQIVLIIPGNMGSLQFQAHAEAAGKHVIIAEGESTPYDARIIEPGLVYITFRNARNAIAFLNKEDESKIAVVDELFGAHKFLRTNVVESALHNPNMVVHTIGTIMSASRIEYAKGEFWMYRESFSESVWNLIRELDKEKNGVIQAYGGEPLSYLDACKWRNEENLEMDSLEVFKGYARHGGPKGPDSLNTRFLYEDVPMGLCLLERLGKMASIETPIASSLVNIASALMQTDYRSISYTFEELLPLRRLLRAD